MILYQIGSTIRFRDKLGLEDILLRFHANEEIQQMCRTALANAQTYLVLQCQEGKGEQGFLRGPLWRSTQGFSRMQEHHTRGTTRCT